MAKKKESTPAQPTPTKYPVIPLRLATSRDDGGKTENYRVYEGGGQVSVTNKRGETVQKNAILGGNGTVYIANEHAQAFDAWVLIPRPVYDRLMAGKTPKEVK